MNMRCKSHLWIRVARGIVRECSGVSRDAVTAPCNAFTILTRQLRSGGDAARNNGGGSDCHRRRLARRAARSTHYGRC